MTVAARPSGPSVGPSSQGLHYSFEKAGLTLDRQPIPWNAEAVLVEANVTLASPTPKLINDFSLHLPGRGNVAPETWVAGTTPGQTRLFFRIAVPSETAPAEFRWQGRTRGQINLPILTEAEFLANLKIVEPTVHVRIKDEAFAARAFVGSQTKEIIASMLLTSPTSLAPLADYELRAEMVAARGRTDRRVVRLESRQLSARQALVVVPFKKPRATQAHWSITWKLGGEDKTTLAMRSVRPGDFQKSLRISTTRLYLQSGTGSLPLARVPPASFDGITRMGPVFLVSSGISGIAAMAEFRVRVLDRSRKLALEMPPIAALVGDGPTVIAPGTVACESGAASFELFCEGRRLGELSILPTPIAAFTAEGGIANGATDYAWSAASEQQLQQKLQQLLGGN